MEIVYSDTAKSAVKDNSYQQGFSVGIKINNYIFGGLYGNRICRYRKERGKSGTF